MFPSDKASRSNLSSKQTSATMKGESPASPGDVREHRTDDLRKGHTNDKTASPTDLLREVQIENVRRSPDKMKEIRCEDLKKSQTEVLTANQADGSRASRADEFRESLADDIKRIHTVDMRERNVVHSIIAEKMSTSEMLRCFSKLSKPLSHGMQTYLSRTGLPEQEFIRLMKFVGRIANEDLPAEEMSIIHRGSSQLRTLSRQHVATVLARSLLCLHRDAGRSHLMPQVNFTETFDVMQSTEVEKIRCIMNYFDRLSRGEYETLRDKTMTFERVCLSEQEQLTWERLSDSTTPLCDFQVDHSHPIEDTSSQFAKVDFANMYLGGGVLNTGCLQEEITFTICPELICGMLLMEAMDHDEAIIISGFERYSRYSGYARGLKYEGNFVDNSRTRNWLIAIDAMELHGDPNLQYLPNYMLRDINKAYAGFKRFGRQSPLKGKQSEKMDWQPSPAAPPQLARPSIHHSQKCDMYTSEYQQSYSNSQLHASPAQGASNQAIERVQKTKPKTRDEVAARPLPQFDTKATSAVGQVHEYPDAIATGNWGCGAFGGDPQLKSLLQWIAASEAGCRQLLYCTMGHPDLRRLKNVTEELSKLQTVGQLVTTLQAHSPNVSRGQKLFSVFESGRVKCTII
jgi:poly(ADP-ribose) glycohydrolase